MTVQSSRLFPDARVNLSEVRVDLRVLGRTSPEAAKVGYELLDGVDQHFLSAQRFEQEIRGKMGSEVEPVQQLHNAVSAAVTAASRSRSGVGAPAVEADSNVVAGPDFFAECMETAVLFTAEPETARRLAGSIEAMTVSRPVAEVVAETAFVVSPKGTGLAHFADIHPLFQLISGEAGTALSGRVQPDNPITEGGKDNAVVLTHEAVDTSDYELGQRLARLVWYQNYFPGSAEQERVFDDVVGESKLPPEHVAEILFMHAGGFYLSGAADVLKQESPALFDMCESALGKAPKATRLFNPKTVASDIHKMIEGFRK